MVTNTKLRTSIFHPTNNKGHIMEIWLSGGSLTTNGSVVDISKFACQGMERVRRKSDTYRRLRH